MVYTITSEWKRVNTFMEDIQTVGGGHKPTFSFLPLVQEIENHCPEGDDQAPTLGHVHLEEGGARGWNRCGQTTRQERGGEE